MKIGILTYHRSQNYGALLQALAMQQYLENLGNEVSFIDYWPDYHDEAYKLFSWDKFSDMGFKSKMKYLVRVVGTCVRHSLRQRNTRRFINDNLHITKDINFDLVIYGSDQVWRKQPYRDFIRYNPVYFGEGLVETTHKIAYAASMGKIEYDEAKDKEFLTKGFSNFDAISVRESDLKDFIEKEFNISCKLVLDPVLLLTKEQWKSKTNSKYLPKGKYILYYRLQDTPETDKIVRQIVRQTGLSVVELRGCMSVGHYGKRYRFTADAQEFISLISGAEYVVTSSFHGTAFSIRFEKDFYIAAEIARPNRVKTLLKQVGLSDRMIEKEKIDLVNANNHIDYNVVNQRLQELVKDSQGWLCQQIEKYK